MQNNLNQEITQKIHFIRGHRVLLDSDLANLYRVKTYNLNKAVKRNLARFPEDFMFQLSEDEFKSLIFQIGISKTGRGGRRFTPYAFTQEGVAMLSSVLKSERAVSVNIEIMRAFVLLRQLMESNKEIARKLSDLEKKYDAQFKVPSLGCFEERSIENSVFSWLLLGMHLQKIKTMFPITGSF